MTTHTKQKTFRRRRRTRLHTLLEIWAVVLLVLTFFSYGTLSLPLQILDATYRVVNVDVTHKAPVRHGAFYQESRNVFSSYQVAVMDVSFNQPLFYRGLSMLDVAEFVAGQHAHHRILDDVVQMECQRGNATFIVGSKPPPLFVKDQFQTMLKNLDSHVRNRTAPAAAGSSSSSTPPPPQTAGEDSGNGAAGIDVPDVYLVPLMSAKSSRYQWLRALYTQKDMAFSRLHSQYVNWNRISFALLLSSSIQTPPKRSAHHAHQRGGDGSVAEHLDASSRRVEELILETQQGGVPHTDAAAAAGNQSSPIGGASADMKQFASTHVKGLRHQEFFPVSLLTNPAGSCVLKFGQQFDEKRQVWAGDEEDDKKERSPTSIPSSSPSSPSSLSSAASTAEPSSPSSLASTTTASSSSSSPLPLSSLPAQVSSPRVLEKGNVLTNRKAEPFVGATKLHSFLATGAPISASSSSLRTPPPAPATSIHLVHQHDDELSFLAEAEDVQGRSQTASFVGLPGFLLSPIQGYITESAIPRIADFIRNKIQNKFQPAFIKKIFSSEFEIGAPDFDAIPGASGILPNYEPTPGYVGAPEEFFIEVGAKERMRRGRNRGASAESAAQYDAHIGIGISSPLLQLRTMALQEMKHHRDFNAHAFVDLKATSFLDEASFSKATASIKEAVGTMTLLEDGHLVYHSLVDKVRAQHTPTKRQYNNVHGGKEDRTGAGNTAEAGQDGPTASLPNGIMTKQLIQDLSAQLIPTLARSLANQVVEDNHGPIATKMTEELVPYLQPRLKDSVPRQVVQPILGALKENVPKIVHEYIPGFIAEGTAQAIFQAVTRGVVHILAPTLSHTLKDAAHIEPVCYYCWYVDPRYCYLCPASRPVPDSAQAHLDLYIIDFYADYYTDYYADKFVEEEPKAEVPNPPDSGRDTGSPFAKNPADIYYV